MIYKKLTPIKKRAFLEMLTYSCNVSRSARHIGISRAALYKARQNDPYFAADWAYALELGFDALEDEMCRRAFEGEVVINQYGTYRKYSDILAVFLMKAKKPSKYCNRYRSELSGANKAVLSLDDPKVATNLTTILNKALLRAN